MRLSAKRKLTATRTPIVVAFATILPLTMKAQGSAAREYLNVPIDTTQFFVDIVGTNAETAAASDLPLPNKVIITRNGFLSFLWSFPLSGKYGGLVVNAGYAAVKINGPLGTAQTSGFTDPSIAFHANLYGAPALRLEQFPTATPQTLASFHLTVNAPLGSYDRNSPVNTGANRWASTPVLNLDITPDKGVSWIDLYAGARFVTTNSEFMGNNRLTQKLLLVLTVHYSHNIGRKTWASIGLHYDNGGQSFINNIPQNDYANGFRPAVAISRRIGKFSVALRYENTASRPNAAPTNGLLSLRVSGPVYPF